MTGGDRFFCVCIILVNVRFTLQELHFSRLGFVLHLLKYWPRCNRLSNMLFIFAHWHEKMGIWSQRVKWWCTRLKLCNLFYRTITRHSTRSNVTWGVVSASKFNQFEYLLNRPLLSQEWSTHRDKKLFSYFTVISPKVKSPPFTTPTIPQGLDWPRSY